MAFKIHVGDHSMMVDDFNPEELGRIAARHQTEDDPLNWLRVALFPAHNMGVFHDLVALVAKTFEQPIPDRPATVTAAQQFLATHLEVVNDDLPDQFGDNGLPLEGAAESTTGSSSTSTAAADGDPSTPAVTPIETFDF